MPHVVLEYADIDTIAPHIEALLSDIAEVARASEIVNFPGLKLRAIPLSHFRVSDKLQGFVHITITMMAGPKLADRQTLSTNVFQAVAARLEHIEQVTVDLRLADPDTYRKRD